MKPDHSVHEATTNDSQTNDEPFALRKGDRRGCRWSIVRVMEAGVELNGSANKNLRCRRSRCAVSMLSSVMRTGMPRPDVVRSNPTILRRSHSRSASGASSLSWARR